MLGLIRVTSAYNAEKPVFVAKKKLNVKIRKSDIVYSASLRFLANDSILKNDKLREFHFSCEMSKK